MQRRTALKAIGSAVGLSVFGNSLSASQDKPTWQLAVGLNGFMSSEHKYGKKYPIRDILSFARRTGFDGIELVQGWPMGNYPSAEETAKITALKRLYDEFDLRVFSIQLGVAAAFDPSQQVREQWLKEFRDRASFAQQVGCQCIGMWPGGGLRNQSIDAAIKHLAGSFREAAKFAADLNLVAAFEIEPPFVFNTEQHLRRILEEADSPYLKTIYDPSHFDLMNGSLGKPHEMLERIGVQHVGYVHLTDTDGTMFGGTSKHLACGDGHANIPLSLKKLLDGGFEGWIMIDAWMIRDPYDACIKGKQAIDQARGRS
jgi:sugar phosphate isomerase/epimerase